MIPFPVILKYGNKLPGRGQQEWFVPGNYNFVVPDNVKSISIVVVGGGGPAGSAQNSYATGGGGGGGGLSYRNDIAVTPGETLTVQVGAYGVLPNNGGVSRVLRQSSVLVTAEGGLAGKSASGGVSAKGSRGGYGGKAYSSINDGGGSGGSGGDGSGGAAGGSGGAGGYSGAGGSKTTSSTTGGTGAGGAAGAGGQGSGTSSPRGGAVGLHGQGANGTGGTLGNVGNHGSVYSNGIYCGAGNGSGYSSLNTHRLGDGGVRIIWGPGRSFPNTNTQDV